MNEELLMQALKKIDDLNKKLEKYYDLLHIENELDFVLKGTYIMDTDIDNIVSGNY
ncbi:MAG: hypothetical protein ACLRFL_01560 [Clostridia bacterium]